MNVQLINYAECTLHFTLFFSLHSKTVCFRFSNIVFIFHIFMGFFVDSQILNRIIKISSNRFNSILFQCFLSSNSQENMFTRNKSVFMLAVTDSNELIYLFILSFYQFWFLFKGV